MEIIQFEQRINLEKLKESRKLPQGLIAPAAEQVESVVVQDHAAEPIKSLNDIDRISTYLISRKRWRDNMLFILGINFGLRCSDLRELRFCNLINDNFTFKDTFAVFEKKTRKTRKKKKNRYISINNAVMEAVMLYLENTPNVSLSDYLFKSEARRTKNKEWGEPLTVRAIEYILKGIAKDLDLNMHVSTHTLRKTFCYHQMVMSNNDHRKLLLLQKMMNHSSPQQTLDYIGITSEEIEEAYKTLNLGYSKFNYLQNTSIVEFDNSETLVANQKII